MAIGRGLKMIRTVTILLLAVKPAISVPAFPPAHISYNGDSGSESLKSISTASILIVTALLSYFWPAFKKWIEISKHNIILLTVFSAINLVVGLGDGTEYLDGLKASLLAVQARLYYVALNSADRATGNHSTSSSTLSQLAVSGAIFSIGMAVLSFVVKPFSDLTSRSSSPYSIFAAILGFSLVAFFILFIWLLNIFDWFSKIVRFGCTFLRESTRSLRNWARPPNADPAHDASASPARNSSANANSSAYVLNDVSDGTFVNQPLRGGNTGAHQIV